MTKGKSSISIEERESYMLRKSNTIAYKEDR